MEDWKSERMRSVVRRVLEPGLQAQHIRDFRKDELGD
jgi:hypothetical protein